MLKSCRAKCKAREFANDRTRPVTFCMRRRASFVPWTGECRSFGKQLLQPPFNPFASIILALVPFAHAQLAAPKYRAA